MSEISKLKKLILAGFVVLSYVGYSYSQRHDDSSGPVIPPTTTTQNSTNPTTPTPTPTPAAQSGNYKDGTYTGDVADAFYGNIQVQAVIQNGKITDVVFLQYPNDRSNSVRINTEAMPYLRQEAIQAQSASVDIVTGATDSSGAFRESLGTALDKAKI